VCSIQIPIRQSADLRPKTQSNQKLKAQLKVPLTEHGVAHKFRQGSTEATRMDQRQITPAQRARRIAVGAAMVRRALVDQDCAGGAILSTDEMVCMLGLIESGADELQRELLNELVGSRL